jgi:methyl-accepting chemotaxis protein
MITGQRGFALTGDESSLEPYPMGMDDLEKSLAMVKELTSIHPEQPIKIDEIAQSEQNWIAINSPKC